MHQIQVQFLQKNEPNSAERQQKAPEQQKVKGDSFRTVLAKEKNKKKSQPSDNKKKVLIKKKEQYKKHIDKFSGKETHKKKKDLLSDKSKIKPDRKKLDLKKTDLKRLDKEKLNPGVEGKDLRAEKKNKEKKNKIEKKPVRSHTSALDSVAVFLSAGSLKQGKTPVAKEQNKALKDKKETGGVKKAFGFTAKESSGVLKVIDLRSKKHTSVKGNVKRAKDNHHKNNDTDALFKNMKHDQDQGNMVKLVTTHQADKNDVPDTPRFLAPTEAKAVLLKELQDKMNDRIVKESGIVLKDNNSGEIKLILKPESLGKVRIRLHLQDNHLTGKIFVNTIQAQDVFEKNMQNLVKAFTDRGFSMASLNVSVGDRGRDRGQREERKISNRILGVMENSVPVTGNYKYSDNIIDLVV